MPSNITILEPKNFPPQFAHIPQPPKTLYYQGTLPNWNSNFLTVVGSRKFSQYGKEACEHLIAGLTGYPIVIVSGLALGIDSIAHRAALRHKLTTIAFPGSGLDHSVLYPPSNKNLADAIVEAGGAIVSEFDPLLRAAQYTFPQRNRLMAGLSQATLIIEASEKSGTLITARLALDYNREVLALPGSIFNPGSHGPNQLIREGATPITSATDILDVFGLVEQETKKAIPNPSDLTEPEQAIYRLLAQENLTRDRLIASLTFDIITINTTLSLMEIKGLITESDGEFRLY